MLPYVVKGMDVSFSGILSNLEEQVASTFMEQGVCRFKVPGIHCVCRSVSKWKHGNEQISTDYKSYLYNCWSHSENISIRFYFDIRCVWMWVKWYRYRAFTRCLSYCDDRVNVTALQALVRIVLCHMCICFCFKPELNLDPFNPVHNTEIVFNCKLCSKLCLNWVLNLSFRLTITFN